MSTLYNNVEADDPLVAAALAAGALEGTESIARKLASGAKYQQKEAKEALGRHLMTMASTPELLQQLPTTKQQRPEGYNEKAFLFLTRGYAEDHGHSPGGFDSGPGPVELPAIPGHEQYCGARLVVQYDRLCSCGKTFAHDKRNKEFGHKGHSYQTLHICRLAVESLPASAAQDSGEWEEKKTKWGKFWFCRKVIAYLVFQDSQVYEGYREKQARGRGAAPAAGRSSDSGGGVGSSGAAATGGAGAAAGCPSPTSSGRAALGGSSGVWQQPPHLPLQQQQAGDEGALQLQHLSIQEALRQTIGLPGAWTGGAAAGPSGSFGPGDGGVPCMGSGGQPGAAAPGSSVQLGIKRRQGQQQQQQVDLGVDGLSAAVGPVQGPVGHSTASPEAAGAAEQAVGEAEEGEPGAKALREPPAPWAEDRDRVWAFLHVRCGSYPELAAGLGSAEAADAQLLQEWEQLLLSVPVEHLQEMRIANGQCLAHWLATPPDYMDDAEVKQQGLLPPHDPDFPLPQRVAAGFILAAIARLTVPRWRPLLLVRDDISKANPVHRAGRYGHRTQVLELLLQHAPRCAVLQYSQQAWMPYHTALRAQQEEAGGMLLEAAARIADELAAAGAGTQEEVRSRLLYSLSNKWFQGKVEGQVPPFGHDLLLGRCRTLRLLRGEPRLLPKGEWELGHAVGELGGLMALAGYLDRQD